MQHARGQARQAAQAGRIVQIAHQGSEPEIAQAGHALRAGGERQHTHTPSPRAALQVARQALAHIAAAHDEQAFAPKARRQGAERVLV
ncbi:hypothetical protein GCM10023090_13820 [Acidovorax lacteus]|uniref:Uncharacterized protein n=1 Tax=Acidovorax lacteus TaxID=1924988 RepID=A0ABP8L6E1_9BURK